MPIGGIDEIICLGECSLSLLIVVPTWPGGLYYLHKSLTIVDMCLIMSVEDSPVEPEDIIRVDPRRGRMDASIVVGRSHYEGDAQPVFSVWCRKVSVVFAKALEDC